MLTYVSFLRLKKQINRSIYTFFMDEGLKFI